MKMVYIILIAVVVILAIAYLTYRKNHNLAFNEARLKDAVNRVFSESGMSTLKRSDFLLRLKQILSCTQAGALYVWSGSNQRAYRGRQQAGQQGSIVSCIAPQCLFYTTSIKV